MFRAWRISKNSENSKPKFYFEKSAEACSKKLTLCVMLSVLVLCRKDFFGRDLAFLWKKCQCGGLEFGLPLGFGLLHFL
jgi:hypothetical protein